MNNKIVRSESVSGRVIYLKVLEFMHKVLNPSFYLEIGVRNGGSLSLATCNAIGIDPAPNVTYELGINTCVVEKTSDEFFNNCLDDISGNKIDFAFIDGMHLFEFALRDFINIEKHASQKCVVVIDDVFPNHPLQAARERVTNVWTGDVWKVCDCLEKWRPDLCLKYLDTSPTGLLIISGLNPYNSSLEDDMESILNFYKDDKYKFPPDDVLLRKKAEFPDFAILRKFLLNLDKSKNEGHTNGLCKESFHNKDVLGDSVKPPILSVIVVCFNMERELPRTVISLSAKMQRDIREDNYEIIVVDNGSTHKFDPDYLKSLGNNISYLVVDKPTKSPVNAANLGLNAAKGRICGVLIDGARMVTPGLLASVILAASASSRAVIATVGFHLGPEHQSRSVLKGYDQSVEDSLLYEINWSEDPYRLFDIATFAGSSINGWFSPMSESNALFMARDMWDELEGYDNAFQSPGGGLANLDIYKRACELDQARLTVILGEGTFHQIHAGVSSNSAVSKWKEFHDEYMKLRGIPYSIPQNEPYYLGKINKHALAFTALSAQHLLKG